MTDETPTPQGFTRQYAILMPDGSLYGTHRQPMNFAGFIFFARGGADEEEEALPIVWDDRKTAEEALGNLKERAKALGITEWLGTIVSRLCSPFSIEEATTAFDIGDEFADWLKEQGEQ